MKFCPNGACFEEVKDDDGTHASTKPVPLLPAGRATLDMGSGAILEAIVLVCPKCRTLSLEQAAVSTVEIPKMPRIARKIVEGKIGIPTGLGDKDKTCPHGVRLALESELGLTCGQCIRRCFNCKTRLADWKPGDPVEDPSKIICDTCNFGSPDPDKDE